MLGNCLCCFYFPTNTNYRTSNNLVKIIVTEHKCVLTLLKSICHVPFNNLSPTSNITDVFSLKRIKG